MIFDEMNVKYLPGKKLTAEFQNNFFGYFLYRIPSFFISFIFISLKLPASLATFISLISAICLPIISILGYPEEITFPLLALLSFNFHLFDHIDGNVARVTKTSSNFGQYFDMLCGILYWPLLYLSIGHSIDNSYEGESIFNGDAILYSVYIIIFDQLSRIINLYCSLNFRSTNSDNKSKQFSKFAIMKSIFVSFKRLAPILIYFLFIFSLIDYYIIIMISHSLFGFIIIIATNYHKISKL